MDGRGTGVQTLSTGADLHLHSTASDGTLAPSEVVRLAAEAELAAIALTDHDTLGGLVEAREAGDRLGVRVLAGCEFSVKAAWGEVHLLGYCLALGDQELNTALDGMRKARADRGRAIVAAVNACGIGLDIEDVERAAGGATIGRPHVARALIARRAVRSLEEAFDRFLGRGRPAYVGKVLPTLEATAGLIRRAGGISSLAHPKDRVSREGFEALRDQGLDGLEIRHPSHRPAVREELERVADDLGFLKTGGSDCHGAGAASPSHSVVGGERIPMEWVEQIESMAAGRQRAASARGSLPGG